MFVTNLYTYSLTSSQNTILRSDGAIIPDDPGNTDYQAYLVWVAAGNTPAAAPGPNLPALISQYSDAIDSLVASIYATWARFQQEYLLRAAAAQSFADAGYEGDPGIWVTGFATAAGLSNTQATQVILQQSALLNGALASLGALRMRKYELIPCPDVPTLIRTYDTIVADINQIAAQLS